MRIPRTAIAAPLTLCLALGSGVPLVRSQTTSAPGTVQVDLVITAEAPNDNSEVPVLTAANVQVNQGKNILKGASIVPARGDNAGLQLFQSVVAKIADETGGEYFALGTQTPVSLRPYLDRLQTVLNNQYFLVFEANPGKKYALQRVRISTILVNVEIAAPDNVWVPTAGA